MRPCEKLEQRDLCPAHEASRCASERGPEIHRLRIDPAERGTCHADHGEGLTVEHQGPSHDIRIGTEPPVPESVTQDHDPLRSSRPIIVEIKQAPARRSHPQEREELPRNRTARHQLCVGALAEIVLADWEVRGDRGHAASPVPERLKVQVRARSAVRCPNDPFRTHDVKPHHLLRSTNARWRLEEQPVQYAEHDGGTANPQPQRENHDGREARTPCELS
jgi:hypothetical protein